MTSPDDRTLIRQLRSGVPAAFETTVKTHYESVWRQHLLLCGDHDNAADLTQETFVEAWRSLPTFRGRSTLRTWLHTIAVRVWRRTLSAKRLDYSATPELLDELPELAPTTGDRVAHTLLVESVSCALLRLPEAQRAVIVLCYRMEMTHAEAAEALEIPIGTVKSRLHEGLRHLRRLLGSTQEEV